MKVRLSIEGTAPLLMHNIRLADPLNPIAKAMKAISSKRKKTDDDLAQLARLEFEGGLYVLPDLGPYLPGVPDRGRADHEAGQAGGAWSVGDGQRGAVAVPGAADGR